RRSSSPACPGRPRPRPPLGPKGAVGFHRVARIPPGNDLTLERRVRLLDGVSALAGANVQRLWLPSAAVAVLQLRVPGRTALAVLDARLGLAAIADERPTSPDSAPRSQATLRAALEGSTLIGAALMRPHSPRLDFSNGRSLIAETALLLIDRESRRILWASAGAQRRPGSTYPE